MLFSFREATLLIAVFITSFVLMSGTPVRATPFDAYELFIVVGVDEDMHLVGTRIPTQNAETCYADAEYLAEKLTKLKVTLPSVMICQAAGTKA